MTVRDSRPADHLVGSRSRVDALLALRDGPGTLTELTRRTNGSKSALRIALDQLVEARAARAEGGRFALTARGGGVVESLLALEVSAVGPTRLDPYAGQWVALDEHDQVIAAATEPKDLVADLRRRAVIAKGLMRVPEAGRRFEGANAG